MPYKFSARIQIIGVNPYVIPPAEFINSKGPIPIKGKINGHEFTQTLVKFQGAWRLYVNGPMLKATRLKVGDTADFEIEYDNVPRIIPMHKKFKEKLYKNKKAKEGFAKLSPSHQKEINRYLNNIKSDEVRDKNIEKVVKHLSGEKTDYFVILRNKK